MFKKIVIANQNIEGPMDDGNVVADHVQPFILEKSSLRGRIVRLPSVIDTILSAHNYPEPLAKLLAEALCLTTLLAGMLKFNGVFTMQAKGQNALHTLVCDMTNEGVLRGTVTYDAERFAEQADLDFKTLMGNGYLAFTVDQADSDDRTQGIVPLEGATLTACVRNYFVQSEQVETSCLCHVGRMPDGQWVGGAMMLQDLARQGGFAEKQADEIVEAEFSEDWQRALTLMHSLTEKEVLDKTLPLNTVLYRLFHEEGVRVFPPIEIKRGCRCNPEKIKPILQGLSEGEKEDYSDDGIITVTCEFCNTTYSFPVEDLS